jgi:hypothetical protein
MKKTLFFFINMNVGLECVHNIGPQHSIGSFSSPELHTRSSTLPPSSLLRSPLNFDTRVSTKEGLLELSL